MRTGSRKIVVNVETLGSDLNKQTHELTQEEYFNDPDRVRADVGGHKRVVKYAYTDPGPGGPFKGTMSDPTAKKGDVIPAMMGRAKVTSVSKTKGEALDNMQLYQRGKVFHKEAVTSALTAGKHVPPKVLSDYPNISINAIGFDGKHWPENPEEDEDEFRRPVSPMKKLMNQ